MRIYTNLNTYINSLNESVKTIDSLMLKSEEISNGSNFLNCELFCVMMFDNKNFKIDFQKIAVDLGETEEEGLENLMSIVQTGDIVGFGYGDNIRHYAIFLEGDRVLEVEQWGDSPRENSLMDNLSVYGGAPIIYRES